MKTIHKFIVGDSRKKTMPNESVDLVITSPPYPMVEMWDEIFCKMNKNISLDNPLAAFELMNKELEKVYVEAYNSLKIGGIMVINIGDATRTINGIFNLYPNGAKTIEMCSKIGFEVLPQIYWWKPTNSPNKFMGSGMLPVGAYVTLETENILIFRKKKRNFSTEKQKINRRHSAFFYNERNLWFSSIWKDLKGASQKIEGVSRNRSAAFPIEMAYRLINMFSTKEDIVWDPFGGTGTTSIAAILSARNSVITDIEESFIEYSINRISKFKVSILNEVIEKRVLAAKEYAKSKKVVKNVNKKYGPVFSKQETEIILNKILEIKVLKNEVEAIYEI